MYEHILVPTDQSDGAERAVDRALEIARRHDATLHLLYVLDEDVFGEMPALSTDELYFDDLIADVQDDLDTIAERAEAADVEAETHTCRGTPHEEILAYAEELDADVIVMGRHGVGDHGQVHLGSVTDRVLRGSSRPVLTV